MSRTSGAINRPYQRADAVPATPPALHTFSFANGRAPKLDSEPVQFCVGFTVGRNEGPAGALWHVDITVEEATGLFVTKRYDLAPLYD